MYQVSRCHAGNMLIPILFLFFIRLKHKYIVRFLSSLFWSLFFNFFFFFEDQQGKQKKLTNIKFIFTIMKYRTNIHWTRKNAISESADGFKQKSFW